MTRFGMAEADFEALAGYVAAVVVKGRKVAEDVARERRRFLEMRYCLPVARALPLAAELLASLLPASDYARRFADALGEAARQTSQ
jgi:hypothetical protein